MTGDIFLTDNERTASKIVKFLMQSPTVYQQVWRWMRGTLEVVRYYHAGIILNNTQVIEQQGVVEINDLNKIFKKKYIIWQNKTLTDEQRQKIITIAKEDLGEGYGILECFGKLITWITGIKWFSKWFDMKNNAICVVRVAEWYKKAVNQSFGVSNVNYVTTKIMDEFCQRHPDWMWIARKT